jgi:hypothetical protein
VTKIRPQVVVMVRHYVVATMVTVVMPSVFMLSVTRLIVVAPFVQAKVL